MSLRALFAKQSDLPARNNLHRYYKTRTLVLYSLFLILLVSLAGRAGFARAQEGEGAVYVVQEGDTLWSIAQRFGVSLDDLVQANGIGQDAFLKPGDRLLIPGLEGFDGALVTQTVPYGETLRSLSRLYGVPITLLSQINHISSPAELYVGSSLILPESSAQAETLGRASLAPGQSLLELAVLRNSNPWSLAVTNAFSGTWGVLPGDILRFSSPGAGGPGALPEQITSVDINPFPLVQGKTTVLRLQGSPGVSLAGSLAGRDFHFFPDGEGGGYVGLQGVHALAEPGLYPLQIQGVLEDGTPFGFSQTVLVQDGQYIYDVPLTVPEETLDPAVTRPEDAQWAALTAPATPDKLWDGSFVMPSPLSLDYCLETNECWSSRYGSRRSYNGSPYNFFHTGLDFYGGTGTEIYAPAGGIVVFTGFLTVRGNATVINHGWGVYSAYMHQSEIRVQTGDRVEAGQVIGLVGGTGRVEGPHLHWEIFVGGVQVEPLDWLQRAYP